MIEDEKDVIEGVKVLKNNTLGNIKCNVKTFKNTDEGYALDWSYLKTGTKFNYIFFFFWRGGVNNI